MNEWVTEWLNLIKIPLEFLLKDNAYCLTSIEWMSDWIIEFNQDSVGVHSFVYSLLPIAWQWLNEWVTEWLNVIQGPIGVPSKAYYLLPDNDWI